MQIWLQWAWLALWLWPQLLAWQRWEEGMLALRKQWQEDYEELGCAQLKAFEKNLEAGRDFLARRRPDPSYREGLNAAMEEMLQLWEPALAAVCGGEGEGEAGFVLYPQQHPELALDYPNWWVRWQED